MSRRKLQRYHENTLKENILEPGKPLYEHIRGRWNEDYFHNEYPITVELGCGRGEYSTGFAPQFPYRNFVGVDVKGDRMWKGALIAEAQELKNVAFLRATIDFLDQFFAPGEISEIWLPFPDPRPKENQEKRRLTSPRYLQLYRKLMIPGGMVHLKTDNSQLFDFTLEVLKTEKIKDLEYTRDLYHSELMRYHYGIQTRYEQKYVKEGMNIHYLHFKFDE